jgi:hypothetical protein
MSEVDLRPVEQKVKAVERRVGAVERGVDSVSGQVTTVGTQVHAVQTAMNTLRTSIASLDEGQQATQAAVVGLREEFASFRHRNELAQTKQMAQTELIEVRQTLEREYGHYVTLRRTAVGTLQAMDTGIVGPAAVQDLTEELMLTTPGYWLAPALVALGAWLRDDAELSDRAIVESLRRDRDKSALFFILVLQRQRRDTTVARWVEHYVENQDPLALAPEFRIVLDATTTGLFGDAPRARVADTVRQWTADLGARTDPAASQVKRWVSAFSSMRSATPDSPALRDCSPEWPHMAELAARASVFGGANAFLDSVLAAELVPDPALEVRVDAVLDRLTGDFDREEAPLRHRAAELKAVIEHDGDVEAARTARAGAGPPDATIDFLSLLGDAALDDETVAPPATRRLAIALSRPWAISAVDHIASGLRNERPRAITLRHNGWQGLLDEETSISALRADAHEHHDRRTDAEVAGVRLDWKAWAAGLASLLGSVLGVMSLIDGRLVLGLVLLVLAVVAGLWVGSEVRSLPRRRAQVRAEGARRQSGTDAAIKAAVAAVQRWLEEFDTALADAGVLRERLDALDVDDHLGSPVGARQGVLTP